MKRFIGLVLLATVSFVGIGGLIDQVGAKFKSDDRALALLQKARTAIGGDTNINNVRSMTIIGKSTKQFEIEGVSRTHSVDLEINMELPNRLSKTLKVGNPDGGDQMAEGEVSVFVVKKGDGEGINWTSDGNTAVKTVTVTRNGKEEVVTEDVKPVVITDGKVENGVLTTKDGDKVIIMKKADGDATETTTDGEKRIIRSVTKGPMNSPEQPIELFKTTLGLLLTTPQGLDVSYTYAGEGTVDGSAVEIVHASVGGSVVKLYLDRTTSLPRMISYMGHAPMMMAFKSENGIKPNAEELKVFERVAAPEAVEIQVKYSDYRTVNGVQLPFKWTQSTGGKSTDTTDIVSYEINPANISEKFKNVPTTIVLKEKK